MDNSRAPKNVFERQDINLVRYPEIRVWGQRATWVSLVRSWVIQGDHAKFLGTSHCLIYILINIYIHITLKFFQLYCSHRAGII